MAFQNFIEAASQGNIHELERLVRDNPSEINAMVSANNFEAFRVAARTPKFEAIYLLLSFPMVFAYAESHSPQYDRFVRPFVNEQLSHLREEMNAFQLSNPTDTFDITDTEKTRLYFYMIRHFIRLGTPQSISPVNLLLSIPSVQALAHQAITPNEHNELLGLAISLNRREKIQILLSIPAVRTLHERNPQRTSPKLTQSTNLLGLLHQHIAATAQFTPPLIHHFNPLEDLGLRAAAEDQESSLNELTRAEQIALERVENKYKSDLNIYGVTAKINNLKMFLQKRYEDNPATLQTKNEQVIVLPLEFDDFQKLTETLSADTQARALKSYYQHPVHTAYRYLSKPNLWMSSDAKFVNPYGKNFCSSFEDYQSLIALLFQAATDESTEAVNGYTIEGRIEHFIRELALIGRAHNWDNRRWNRSTKQYEDYDDLEGDKPSCSPGVKRRLFQSVQGHPLMTLLTKDIILEHVYDVVREHFINTINEENCAELYKAWETIIEGRSDDDNVLSQLNFSEEELAHHFESLSQKLKDIYDLQFTPELAIYLNSTLNVDKPFKNLAEKFGGKVTLSDILEQKYQEIKTRPSM